MSLRRRGVGAGLEAISVQRDKALFISLVGMVEELRKNPIDKSTLAKSGIAKKIREATFIDWSVAITDDSWNAHTTIPLLDKNNPFTKNLPFKELGDEDAIKYLAKGKTATIKGWVDLEAGQVHGNFREIPVKTTLGTKLFSGKFSSEEIVSIILHEVGHTFTYFEMLSQLFTLNHAIASAVKAALSPNPKVTKVEVIDAYVKLRGVTIEDKDKLSRMESKDGFTAVLLQAEIQKSVSETGANMYDATGFEYLSDQFSARHGGGIHLVTALDKMQRYDRNPVYRSAPFFYSLELLKFLAFCAGVFSSMSVGAPALAFMLIGMVAVNPHYSTYDLPKDRAERIRKDLVTQLKDRSLPKDLRDSLQDDIKVIDAVTKQMEQRTGVTQLVHKIMSPTTRRQLRQKQAQQTIEEMLNNDMFVNAATFTSLGE